MLHRLRMMGTTLNCKVMIAYSPKICASAARWQFSQRIRTAHNSSATIPIVELREYSLFPASVVKYTQVTSATSNLRKSLTPMKYFGLPETGGNLNIATHLYYYQGGYTDRNIRRKVMAENKEWADYVNAVRPCMDTQKSTIFVEAPFIHTMIQQDDFATKIFGLSAVNDNTFHGADSIIEFRRYQLKLGYDTVPKFLTMYEKGLPSKLLAEGTDPTTSLITLLYCEVGQLNEVIEIWRHQGTEAMEKSRIAARSAMEWREAISSIAGLANVFKNTIHKPLAFSPLR